jgi:hypothetical protein
MVHRHRLPLRSWRGTMRPIVSVLQCVSSAQSVPAPCPAPGVFRSNSRISIKSFVSLLWGARGHFSLLAQRVYAPFVGALSRNKQGCAVHTSPASGRGRAAGAGEGEARNSSQSQQLPASHPHPSPLPPAGEGAIAHLQPSRQLMLDERSRPTFVGAPSRNQYCCAAVSTSPASGRGRAAGAGEGEARNSSQSQQLPASHPHPSPLPPAGEGAIAPIRSQAVE